MHIHATQFNLDMQMYALSRAARAEAKQAAERTRKKLTNFASALAGKVDDEADCIVRFTGEGDPQDQSSQRERQSDSEKEKQNTQPNPASSVFSDWA